jgi:hypothetical protein
VFHAPFLMPVSGAVDNTNRVSQLTNRGNFRSLKTAANLRNHSLLRWRNGSRNFSLMQTRQKNRRLMVNQVQFLKTFIAHG